MNTDKTKLLIRVHPWPMPFGGNEVGDDAYVELHARSAFSFLEGACVPEDLAGACATLDMPAMALLDRNGVYGSPRFHMAAKKAGVRAHIGSEITCDNGHTYPLVRGRQL
jgi:error-prone DNA polymerase